MSTPSENRLWYLAFGSNMNHATLTVMRKVKPIRAIAVRVPNYVLSFDIKGFAYMEPCWASVIKLKEKGEASIDEKNNRGRVEGGEERYKNGSSLKGREENVDDEEERRDVWSRCCPGVPYDGSLPPELCGVAYDITEEEFRQILVTEAGMAYDDMICAYNTIEVDCIPLKSSEMSNEPVEDLHIEGELLCNPKQNETQVIRARTLMALPRSTAPDIWPNFRYLSLIRKGVKRNSLPKSYQEHLDQLCFYEARSWKKFILGWLYIIPFILMYAIMKLIAVPLGVKAGQQSYFVAKSFDTMMKANIWGESYLRHIIGSGWRTDDGPPRSSKEKAKKL